MQKISFKTKEEANQMKKSIKNVAVLFSLVFTLVLTAGVTTVTDADSNNEISTCSDLWEEIFVER